MLSILKNLSVVLFVIASATAQPNITGLSPATVSRSARVLIEGSGFGVLQGTGRVVVNGLTAPTTRWSNTLIAAYVPEGSSVGPGSVQVFDTNGQGSGFASITVTVRQAGTGHVRWRFQADADYIPTRPAVGADGTVYASDSYGHLYAVDSTGGLKWIFNGSGANIDIGPNGTIYVGGTRSIVALNPNGTVKWQFDENPAAFILLGPNVGPDGNIYAVGIEGLGVFSLTPQGSLRWALPESYDRPIVSYQDIVFGPPGQLRLYFHADRHLRGIGLNGTELFTYLDALVSADPQVAVGPDGSLYTNLSSPMMAKLDNNANLLWHLFEFSNSMTSPDVGPDGIIYEGRNLLALDAVSSSGAVLWEHIDSGILFGPVVSPLNNLLMLGGIVTYGQPGFFEAISTNGAPLWKEIQPAENGLNIWPMSRARFTPDGQTAYFGMSIAGQGDNPYTYLYSVQTAPGEPVVSLSSTLMDFGAQGIHRLNAPQTATLSNTGTGSLFISNISIGGSNPNDFAESDNCPRTPTALAPGAHCDITVVFSPTGIGTRTANVTISDNAVDNPQMISLTGIGIGGKVALK